MHINIFCLVVADPRLGNEVKKEENPWCASLRGPSVLTSPCGSPDFLGVLLTPATHQGGGQHCSGEVRGYPTRQ